MKWSQKTFCARLSKTLTGGRLSEGLNLQKGAIVVGTGLALLLVRGGGFMITVFGKNIVRLLGISALMTLAVACGSNKEDKTAPAPAPAPVQTQPDTNSPQPRQPGSPKGTIESRDTSSDSADSDDETRESGKTTCEIRSSEGGEPVKKLIKNSQKYTSASGNYDSLREELMSDMLCQKSDVKLENFKFAARVDRANLMINETGEVLVNIHLSGQQASQGTRKISFGGSLDEVNSLKKSNLILQSGDLAASGTIECMDADGGCRTALVEIVLGRAKNKSQAELRKRPRMQIIFRQSPFVFSPVLGGATAGSSAYSKLVDLIVNYRFRVRSATYYTYEVIGGKSGFRVLVMSKQNEMLIFEGDLIDQNVAYRSQPRLRSKPDTRETDEFFVAGRQADLRLMESLLDARLVDTDNEGHVSIEFKTSSDRRGSSVIFGAEHYKLSPLREEPRLVFE